MPRSPTAFFRAKPLDSAACWVLLQFAGLPEGRYDLEAICAYLNPENFEEETIETADAEDFDIDSLFGFSCFEEEYGQKSKTTVLTEVVSELFDLGWLDDLGDEYSIHATTVEVLKRNNLNQPRWIPELANCLSLNYFTNQHSRLKDNLFYEGHLLSLLDFWGEQANEDCLAVLAKLIQFYNDTVEYRIELRCRQRHLLHGPRGNHRRKNRFGRKL